MTEAGDTTGWHRKWVVLLGVFGWLFLYRYRVMGWLLSKVVTFQLSKSRSRNSKQLAPVVVQVERVSLQPLRFFNVELRSSGSTTWRVMLTKVEVQSHVKEFFESFGLVKICILVIDEAIGDVDKIDDELFQQVFLPKKVVARNSATNPRPRTNPICYMRYVDLKVQNIRLCVNCMDMTTRFLCQGLYVGITDVFVQRDLLQLKVQTKSIILQSCPQSPDCLESKSKSDGSDGVRAEIPTISVLMDLNLRSQRFLGSKLTGCEAQTTSFVVSTAFLERALTARNEFIRCELAVVGDENPGESGDSTVALKPGECGDSTVTSPAPLTPSKFEIDGFHLSLTVVNEVDTIGRVAIQFSADFRKLTYVTRVQVLTEISDTTAADSCSRGFRVHIEALVQNARVHNVASNRKLLSVCSIDLRATQTDKTCGILTGTFETIETFLSHRSEQIFRSLLAVQERVEKCQIEAKRMRNFTSSASIGTQFVLQDKENQLHWDAELQVTSWMMSFKAFAKDGGTDELTVSGTATSIQTPLAPVPGENGSSVLKRSIVAQHISLQIVPNGLCSHSAVIGGAKLTLWTALDPAVSTKTLGTSINFEYLSINGFQPELSGRPTRLPAIYLHHVKVDREVKAAADVTEIDLKLHMESTHVKWHYQEHNMFLLEWKAIQNVGDQLDLLLSSSSKKTRTHAVPKILSIYAYSKETTVDVLDLPDVTSLASFGLVEATVSHRATQHSVTTAFNASNASARWGDNLSIITLRNASFHNRSSRGRQRYLTKIPIQNDIRCSSLKVHLRPQNRLLLFFLRLEKLTSGAEKRDDAKRSSVQGFSFVCGAFSIELEGAEHAKETASIQITTLDVKMTRCSPREFTEATVRLAQSLGKEKLSERSFEDVVHQLLVLEGTASASAISAAISAQKLVELHDTELHFACTDVEWSRVLDSEHGCIIPRTTSFDLSLLTEKLHVVLERYLFDSLFRLMPILQEAFNTKDSDTIEISSTKSNFRQRFAGNLDSGIQNAEFTCPYGDHDDRDQIGRKVTRVLLGEVAFNLRQFQLLGLKCSPLRVMLEDVDFVENSETEGYSRGQDSLQFLYVPEFSVNAVIHWRHEIHTPGQLQYALSLEIAVGHTQTCGKPPHVPLADETLVAVNWDCVYPWLICMLTDDDGEYPVDNSANETLETANRVQCVGVQWDLSITLIQFAWWDTVTQEIGILIVANEFLTHGVLRTDSESERPRLWKLWEATVYLPLFRGYLLHVDDDFNAEEETISDILPFSSEITSNFSLETVGTSYRNTYTPTDNEDWDALDDEVTATFAPSNAPLFDKMHDAFVPIDYEFGIVNHAKPVQQEAPGGRLPMLQVPLAVRTSSATITPPKSPRSAKNWTQNIKNRLSRLKHRSASMDNLFLKDGSCPIQVDAMRLLWTIQTRDSVFYMVSTTVDSLRLLLDAKRNAARQSDVEERVDSLPLSQRIKRNSLRSPSIVSNSNDADVTEAGTETPRVLNRRGSTRDTLLDLLQQGKLGMNQEDRESGSKTGDDESESSRGSIGDDTNDFDAPKAIIAMKAYTVDIHDAQINVREETTQSNMLLASKHIHFEIGTDDGANNTIANLTFDNVTAHVAPIDVDISAGVSWYSHSDMTSPSTSSSNLLKQIMDECSLTSSYTHTQGTGATSTEVDLSFLQLSTDRHQFYQLLNVIRHVLLAPPSVARRPKRTYTPRTYSTESPQLLEGSDITVFVPSCPPANTLAPSTSTKKLHVLLEEELRNREIRTRGTSARSKSAMTALKAISFKVVGMQWKLRLSPEITGADHEFIGIRIQGFTGCHTYFTNHCTKLTLNLQWLEISNLHPGPSSAAFEDPTAVLKAKLLVDKRFESSSKLPAGNQKGMLVVRAESGPIVRVHGQKLRVLEVLEVSMFPEVSNMIVIQLAADFYDLIYKFFFENISTTPANSQNSEQVFFGRKSTGAPVSPTASSSTPSSGQKGASSPFTKSRMPSTSPLAQSSLLPLRKSNSAGSTNSMFADSSSTVGGPNGPNSPTSASSSEEVPDDNDLTATDDCELFYVKYVRVGNVRLRINCNGFFVNLSHFDLDLPPYICQSKLCTTKKLLQKFESHLKWYITKESASSGLSQFKNKLLKWTPSSSSTDGKKDKSKKQEEDTAAANAQVLFGPYSGTTT